MSFFQRDFFIPLVKGNGTQLAFLHPQMGFSFFFFFFKQMHPNWFWLTKERLTAGLTDPSLALPDLPNALSIPPLTLWDQGRKQGIQENPGQETYNGVGYISLA